MMENSILHQIYNSPKMYKRKVLDLKLKASINAYLGQYTRLSQTA